MSPQQKKTQILTTPCIGRCSTTFGDEVCRGCRRYSHEIINWNGMSNEDKYEIWERINKHLDQFIFDILPNADFKKVQTFLEKRKIAQPEKNSLGRMYYLALKFCYTFPSYTEESGLNLRSSTPKEICSIIEDQAYNRIK